MQVRIRVQADRHSWQKNAIDGIYVNDDHGVYPYQSWGMNQKEDAELRIELGRVVKMDKIGITLRADFPYDTYFKWICVEFSDKSCLQFELKKSGETQFFEFTAKEVSWLKVKDLRKGEEGDFSALTQFEAWGYNL